MSENSAMCRISFGRQKQRQRCVEGLLIVAAVGRGNLLCHLVHDAPGCFGTVFNATTRSMKSDFDSVAGCLGSAFDPMPGRDQAFFHTMSRCFCSVFNSRLGFVNNTLLGMCNAAEYEHSDKEHRFVHGTGLAPDYSTFSTEM